MASYGLPAQAKATPRQDPLLFLGGPASRWPGIRSEQASPRPHPWLFMGVQACRLPALKRSKPLKPLKGHFNGFLWASSAGKSYPKARSIAVSGRSSVLFARHSQPTGIPRPLQWLLTGFQRRQKLPQGRIHCCFWAVPRAVRQAFAANGHPKATSMAFSGRPSLPFASPKTLQTPKTPKRPLQWLLMGFQRRQKLPQGQIHCCFWAVQRAVRQAFAANGHPKATSMAFSGRPSLPFASPKTLQTAFQRRQKLPQGQIHCFFLSHPWLVRPSAKTKEPTRSLGVYIYMCVNLRRLLPRPHLYGGVGGTRALAHSILRNRAILLNLYCKQELPMWWWLVWQSKIKIYQNILR